MKKRAGADKGVIDRLLEGESRKITLCTPSFGVFQVSVSSGKLGIPHTNHGPIREVNKFIARIHKADEARITHNGTTSLNNMISSYIRYKHLNAAITSNAHRSVVYAASVDGTSFSYIPVQYDDEFEAIIPPSPEDVKVHLENHPEIGAVMITSPTYEGVYAKMEDIAKVCHKAVALCIADSAWDHLPHVMPKGVDIMVKSTHKMEGADQGGAVILWRDDLIDPNLMHECYSLELSTSPSVKVFQSVENAYRMHVQDPRQSLRSIENLAHELRASLSDIDGIDLLEEGYLKDRWGRHVQSLDAWKLQVVLSDYECTGYRADSELQASGRVLSGIIPEKSGPRSITLLSTLRSARLCEEYCEYRDTTKCGRCTGIVGEVRSALERVLSTKPRGPNPYRVVPTFMHEHETVMRMSDALFGARERVGLDGAVGRVCADIIVPYPPGYPPLVPGQRISRKDVEFLKRIRQLGGEVMEADERGRMITVLKEDPARFRHRGSSRARVR